MKRAIQIAKNGLGITRPNPMVGAVIVYNNKIIGEGFTSSYGGNHAEVNAIQSVTDHTLLKKCTLYVTLEPCSHYGKTPPCSNLIIHHKIPSIVIGCVDNNPKVAGKGVKMLMDAGCQVTVGILEDECKIHHNRFFTYYDKKRPYIILKWAETRNGFIAPKIKTKQQPVWITNQLSRQLVHKWRAQEQAILVGLTTVLKDNPSLTVRNWTGNNPIRVVLDTNGALTKNLSIFNTDAETLVLKQNTPIAICDALYNRSINSIIIEGGAKTLQLFIDQGLWDEARVFTGKVEFKEGTAAPHFYGKLRSEINLLEDELRIYTNN